MTATPETYTITDEAFAHVVYLSITAGLPTPLAVTFVTKDIQVWPADLDAWLEECVADGDPSKPWQRHGVGEMFTARARGFTITAYRDHECTPGDCPGGES